MKCLRKGRFEGVKGDGVGLRGGGYGGGVVRHKPIVSKGGGAFHGQG